MGKVLLPPGLAIVGGLVGLALRVLSLGGTVPYLALDGLTLVMVAALAVLCLPMKAPKPQPYHEAFFASGSTAYVLSLVTASFLVVIAGGLLLSEFPQALEIGLMQINYNIPPASPLSLVPLLMPDLLYALLLLATGVALFLIGKNGYERGPRLGFTIRVLFPPFGASFWLIFTYQTVSGDPIVHNYVYPLMSILLIVLGSYFVASFAFDRPKPRLAVFTALTAIYFTLTAQGDTVVELVALSEENLLALTYLIPVLVPALLGLGYLCYLLATTTILLHNRVFPPALPWLQETAKPVASDADASVDPTEAAPAPLDPPLTQTDEEDSIHEEP